MGRRCAAGESRTARDRCRGSGYYRVRGTFMVDKGGFMGEGGFTIERRSIPMDRRGFTIDRGSIPMDRRGFTIDRGSIPMDRRGFTVDRGSYIDGGSCRERWEYRV